MAVDSLVDKTKLNNSLSYEADRIRIKTGGSADIVFDFANEKGFGDAIDAIPTGGGTDDYEDFTAGNIQAIVSHGTEWIQTDYYGTLTDFISIKLADTSKVSYEGYWSISAGTTANGVQRYSGNNTLAITFRGASLNGLSIAGYADGSPILVVQDSTWLSPITVNLPLVIGRNYHRGAIESTISAFTFYGLNILDSDYRYVKRFMPWLESGEACVKEVISGTVYRNSGTGAYDYIDKEGVLHSA